MIDSLWDKTVLLLPFSEDLQDVKKHIINAEGGVVLSSSLGCPFGSGNALVMDGVDDDLFIADSADWDVKAGNFSIEVWAKFSSHTVNLVLVAQRTTSTSSHAFTFEYNSSVGGLRFSYTTDAVSPVNVDRTWTPTDGVWYFLSVVRNGTVIQIRVDGTQLGADYTIGSVAIWNSSAALRIGAVNATPAGFFHGALGPIRITKEARTISAAPTAPFPRPTVSGTVRDASGALAAKTILFYDRSTQQWLGGANSDPTTGVYTFHPPDFGEVIAEAIDGLFDPPTDECVFDLDPSRGVVGGQLAFDNKGHALSYYNEVKINADGVSFEFDGSADSIFSVSTDYILGTDDFCIDLEFYPIAGGHGGTYARILQIGPNSTVGTMAITAYASANPLQLECTFYNGSYVHLTGAPVTTTFANNTWHKLQVRRVSGVITVTVNDATWATSGTTAYNISASHLVLGGNTSNTESFNGRIGKVRISRGARRAAAAIPASRLLTLPADGVSANNALIYDRVTPGAP